MRASKSLLSVVTLSLVLSTSARAEEILPPYGHEIGAAQTAAGHLSVATSELMKHTNLFIRKNHLGDPQNAATIHHFFRPAYEDVRNMQAAARAVQNTVGTADSLNAYFGLKNTFLSLNTTIRSMKNSGLKNALQVGQEFDNVRNRFESVRGLFISRWKNKQWVEASAARSLEAVRYSVNRLKEILDAGVNPGPIAGNPAQSVERSRVVIAQMRVIRDDVQNFQAGIAFSARDPRTGGLQHALNELRQSVVLLNQIVARPGVVVDAQTETNAVVEAVRQLDEAFMAELQ